MYENCVKFLTAPVTIPINAETDMGASKIALDVRHCAFRRLYLYAKGKHASCSKAVDFVFQVSPDGVTWHDLQTLSVTLNGTAQVTDKDTCVALDLRDVNYVRLDRVKNNETTTAYTADVAAFLSGKI